MRNRPLPAITEGEAAYARSFLLYEDASVLVFNKPSGLAVQGGAGVEQSLDYLLVAFAKSNGKKPRLVHRLDRGTSGVIIAGRTKPAAAFLSEEFASRRARKTYLALVEGRLPKEEEGVMDKPLMKVEESGRIRMIVVGSGLQGSQDAVTHWRVLARQAGRALMELRPETGRMHQIRVHLSSAGCPILGDDLYGADAGSGHRLMLHASALEINHPEEGCVPYKAPVPNDFLRCAEALDISDVVA